MGIDLGSINARLSLNINNFSSNLRRAEEEIRETERSFSGFTNIGKRFSDVGDKLTKAFTVPIVGAGVAATKFAMDFETGMAKVSTIADTSKASMDQLKHGVVDLSNKTGASTKDLNEALYQSISAGVDTAKSVDFLNVAVKAAKGGFSDTATAVDGLSTVLNSYGLAAKDANKIANQMLITQNKGKTDFNQLASAVGKVTPVAAALGIKTEELFSSLATTTAQGLATAESVTALKAAMSNIIKPSKEASEAAEALGINFSVSAVKSKGWIGFLGDVKDKLKQASPEFAKLSSQFEVNSKKLGELEKSGKKGSAEYKQLSKANKQLTKDLEQMAKMADSPVSAFAQMFGSVEGLNSILMLTSENGMQLYNDTMKEMANNTGALDDAYNKMSETTAEKFNKALNKLKNSGMELGVKLLPILEKFAQFLSNLADKFSRLSPKQQDFIIKAGFMAAALGPLLSIGGRLFSGVSKLAGGIKTITALFGTAQAATAGTALATEGAAVATGGLGTAIGGALITLAPWIIGIGAAGFAIYKLAKHFKSDAIPAVDLFGDKTSESTKKAVGAYMNLDDKATKSLMNLNYRSEKVSKETATSLTKNFNDMGKKIKDGLDKHYKESRKAMEDFFKNSKALTDKEEKEALKKMQSSNEAKKKEIDSYTKEINSILEKASKDGRKLKEEEVKQIETLQQKMKENAVKVLSETELESKAILERMKAQHGDLTAQQAADVVKNSNDQKEKAIKAANDQYNETVKAIIKQRDETKAISSDQANKLIADATRQRDEAIKKASDMHNQVVSHAKAQAKGHVTEVNWETGQVLSKFDSMMAKIREFNALSIKEKVITITQKINSIFENQNNTGLGTMRKYAKGTDGHPGGFAVAGEEGEELVIGPNGQIGLTANTATLYNLPKGTKVIPHGKTKSILSSFNIPGYKDGVGINSNEKKQGLIDQIENKFSLQYSNLELAMIKLGVNTKTFTEEVKKQQREIDILNKKLALMKNEYNEIVKVAGANSDEAISLRNNIASLTVEISNSTQELKDKISKNAEEAKEKVISETNDLVERVKSALQEKYQEEERKQEESLQNQLDNLDTWKEKSISKIEEVFDKKLEKLEEDKELSEKAFEEESNQLDKWKETSIRNIEEVANAKIKSLQAQIDALDEQTKADERAEADKEELAKIQRIKDKIEFEHNEFNKAELQKELNNVIAERNKRLHQQEIEDKKEALSKQIDVIAEDTENQKQSIEDVYSVRKEDLEKRIKDSEEYFARQKELIEKNRKDQQEAVEKTYTFQKGIIEKQQADWKAFYDKKLQDATLQAEAEKLVMDNNQKEIVELLHTYEPEYLAAGQSLGEKLVEGFAPKIQAIKDMIASINAEISAARSNAISAMAAASQASSAISAASSSNSKGTTNNSTTNSVVNNNSITFNSPISLTPSEVLRKTETTLRNLAFSLG